MLKKRTIGFISAGVLSAVVLIGAAKPDLYFLIKKNFTIFSEVYREVAINYVDEVDPEKLMRKGLDAMLQSLDPYTVFIDEADKQQMDIITRGSYGGIGVHVGVRDDKLVVISPVEGYSAYKKGIRPGDVILSVDGISVKNYTPDEVQELAAGEPGTSVRLTIARYGTDQELTFDLRRERIDVKNVNISTFIDEKKTIGYISLTRFAQQAAAETRQALEKLQAEGNLKGLIIDVRNNPGGLLNEAVNIVDLFIEPDQKVVETRGRMQNKAQVFKSSEPALAPSLPLVIVQNEGSASASEILAGALQDLDRAVIMGSRSFGKGLVQVVQPLSYNTALKITTARYYIPSGRSIQAVTYRHDEANTAVKRPDSLRHAYNTKNGRTVYDGRGIAPDVVLAADSGSILQTALLQQGTFFAFANRYAAEHKSYGYDELPPSAFKAFKAFLKETDFSYTFPAEQHLKKAEAGLAKQDIHSPHIKALEKLLSEEKEQAFVAQSEEIKKMLHLELVGRYGGQAAQNASRLVADPVMRQAVNLLKNSTQYLSILSGKGTP